LNKFLYVCCECLYINDEDFRECPSCYDESPVTQVEVKGFKNTLILSFHPDVPYKKGERLAKAIISKRYTTRSISHSKHSSSLSGLLLEFVVK
jgi:hypothetical protein